MLSRNRLARIRREVDWIIKLPSAERKKLLSLLADEEGVSYDTVKKDLYALAYTVLPGKFPESYSDDVKDIKEAVRKGLLDKQVCESAVLIFLEHDPAFEREWADISGVNDPELDDMISLTADYVKRYVGLKAERLGWHPARKRAEEWRVLGRSVHTRLAKALDTSSQSSALASVRQFWENSLLVAQALWHRELALKALKELSLLASWDAILEAIEKDEVSLDNVTINWVSENAPNRPKSNELLKEFLSQARAFRTIMSKASKRF